MYGKKERYYRLQLAQPIPDFLALTENEPEVETTEYLAHKNDFSGSHTVGSKVVLTTLTDWHLHQHLEGCELAEYRYLDGKEATVIGFKYIS